MLLLLRFSRIRPSLSGVFLSALCAAMLASGNIEAATLIVTTTADSGVGSLRATLAAANDGDTIEFDPALNGQTIALTSNELLINKDITISGLGPDSLAVSKTSNLRFTIIHIMPGHTVTIAGLTISRGHTDFVGGGIWNEANSSLTINNCGGGCVGVKSKFLDTSVVMN